jgi:hypothetical protein
LTDFPGRFAALVRAFHSSRARAALTALAFVVLAGCGKKGPPLAPYSSIPAAPSEITIRRKGDQVVIHFRVPQTNSDGRRPAKIDHVQVYGLTMPAEKIRVEGEHDAVSSGEHGGRGGGQGGHRSGGASRSDGGAAFGAGAGPGAGHELPFRKYGTVVGSVLVRKPPPKQKESKDGETPPPPPPPRTDPGLDQGDAAVIVDTLTVASLTPVEIAEKDLGGASHPHEGDHDHEKADAQGATGRNAYRALVTPPDLGPPLPLPALRYYALAGTNGRKNGPFAPPIAVPVDNLPPAPPTPTVTVAEGKIQVALVLPDGLRKPVLPLTPSPIAGAPAAPPVPASEAPVPAPSAAPTAAAAPTAPPAAPAAPSAEKAASPAASENPIAAAPSPPTTLLPAKLISGFTAPSYSFQVYETAPPDFTPPKQEPGAVPPYPLPLTAAPVPPGIWNDSRYVVGVDRCYSVRLVMTAGLITSESASTPTVCVKTVDTFPPAAPKNLQAVASEGTISLIWDANTEADLAGYIVLRGAAGSDKLTAITPTPIKETTFRDTKVKAGVRYAYVVVAVDTATPQNVSSQSNRVEETAR